jgi:hypothetical protein
VGADGVDRASIVTVKVTEGPDAGSGRHSGDFVEFAEASSAFFDLAFDLAESKGSIFKTRFTYERFFYR